MGYENPNVNKRSLNKCVRRSVMAVQDKNDG